MSTRKRKSCFSPGRAPVAALSVLVAGFAQGNTASISSFEGPDALNNLAFSRASGGVTTAHATEGSQGLWVQFLGGQVGYSSLKISGNWNLSASGAVGFDVTNPGARDVLLGFELEDALGVRNAQTTIVEAGGSVSFAYLCSKVLSKPTDYGIEGFPNPYPGYRPVQPAYATVDLARIAKISFFMRPRETDELIYLDNLKTLPYVTPQELLTGAVDAFGQYSGATWPYKVNSTNDILAQWQQEQQALVSLSTSSTFHALGGIKAPNTYNSQSLKDAFGGYSGAANLGATGYFRVQNVGGYWWLVTPLGNRFFSTGTNAIRYSATETQVTGREWMFSWMPQSTDPLARFYGSVNTSSGPVTTYNFHQANLYRKFGEDYQNKWVESTWMRLKSWGFNTVGKACISLLNKPGKMPYLGFTTINGNYSTVPCVGDSIPMADPFDSKWVQAANTAVSNLATSLNNDPWCVGFVVDNELRWGNFGSGGPYGLAYGAAKLNAWSSPAKQEWVRDLKGEYKNIRLLNRSWRTNFPSWSSVERGFNLPATPSAGLQSDMSRFVRKFAQQYFSVVSAAVDTYAPNHLYLGPAFNKAPDEVLEAAAQSCDAFSMNIYRNTPQEGLLVEKARTLNKPVLITEFHFASLDRGAFYAGTMATPSHQSKAAAFENFVRRTVEDPMFIGCHWYQHVDQPITATLSKENIGCGFVSVADNPYPEMVAAAKNINGMLYTFRP